MFLFQSHHDRILHSTFRRNVPAGSGTGGGIASVESTNTVIRGNLMSRNGEAGIIMERSDGFQIRHNRLVRNHDGIALGPGSHNVITRNHVFRGGDGIRIEKGHGNLVAHNVVAHTRHAGIRLGIAFSTGTSAAPTTSSAETWSGTAARTGSWSERRTAIAASRATSPSDRETTASTSRAARRS